MVISGSLFVGHDIAPAEREQRLQVAQNAIIKLNSIDSIRPILMLIANARCFKIIFDFNRTHIQYLDPAASIDSRGIFIATRHIYIAAKNLLNPLTCHEVFGTLAHELCHFAMELVYGNKCRPYKIENTATIGVQFFKIFKEVRRLRGNEEIIDLVFNYDDYQQIAELIVRVPHMLAFYHDNEEKINELSEKFKSLFKFYEKNVLPDIKSSIDTVGRDLNQRRQAYLDKTVKKASKWRKIAKISLLSIIIVASIVGLIVYNPIYKWNELTEEQKMQVRNGSVNFAGINLKFYELYNINSSVYHALHTEHISKLLNSKILDLNQPKNEHLQSHIFFNWNNLTESLKTHILNASIDFQGQHVHLARLINNDTDIYHHLQSNEILKIIKNELKVGEVVVMDEEIYIERKFIGNLTLNELSVEKFNLLVDDEDAGKTFAFKHSAIKLKEKFPHKWISYIDLETKNLRNMPSLMEILNLKSEFQRKLFKILLKNGDVILLWDQLDELTVRNRNYAFNIIFNLQINSLSHQWMSIRSLIHWEPKDTKTAMIFNPLGSDGEFSLFPSLLKFVEKFSIKPLKLLPFTKANQDEYLKKFIKSKKLNDFDYYRFNYNVKTITDKFHIRNPAVLKKLAIISITFENTKSINSENDLLNSWYHLTFQNHHNHNHHAFEPSRGSVCGEKFIILVTGLIIIIF